MKIIKRTDRNDPVYDIYNNDNNVIAMIYKEDTYKGGLWRINLGLQFEPVRYSTLDQALNYFKTN